MVLHVFVSLLVVCLFLSLALLCHLECLSFQPSSAGGRIKRSKLPQLLKPRCPDDCPACRLASLASTGGGPAPARVASLPGTRSKAGGEHPSGFTPTASPAQISSVRTSGSSMLRFMPWLGTVSMVRLNRSRPFAVRLAIPHSVLDVIPPCTG